MAGAAAGLGPASQPGGGGSGPEGSGEQGVEDDPLLADLWAGLQPYDEEYESADLAAAGVQAQAGVGSAGPGPGQAPPPRPADQPPAAYQLIASALLELLGGALEARATGGADPAASMPRGSSPAPGPAASVPRGSSPASPSTANTWPLRPAPPAPQPTRGPPGSTANTALGSSPAPGPSAPEAKASSPAPGAAGPMTPGDDPGASAAGSGTEVVEAVEEGGDGGEGGRRLQQQTGPGGLPVPTGVSGLSTTARAPLFQQAQAYRLIFGNFLDLLGGGGRYAATILANLGATLLNTRLVSEAATLLEGPLNNLVNANWFPIPQSNAAALALLISVLKGYCTLQAVTGPSVVLGSYVAPSFTVALQPSTCPIIADPGTGRRSVNWAACTPAALQITTTPWLFNAPFVSGTAFAGGFCRYQAFAGSDQSYTLGGGTAGFTLRRSSQGLQITPVVNQFNLAATFVPYVFPNAPYPATPARGPTTTAGGPDTDYNLIGGSTPGTGTGIPVPGSGSDTPIPAVPGLGNTGIGTGSTGVVGIGVGGPNTETTTASADAAIGSTTGTTRTLPSVGGVTVEEGASPWGRDASEAELIDYLLAQQPDVSSLPAADVKTWQPQSVVSPSSASPANTPVVGGAVGQAVLPNAVQAASSDGIMSYTSLLQDMLRQTPSPPAQ
ncbi:hypothetical protein V8C86DRAFT_2764252 [Haematococcus lacustris]